MLGGYMWVHVCRYSTYMYLEYSTSTRYTHGLALSIPSYAAIHTRYRYLRECTTLVGVSLLTVAVAATVPTVTVNRLRVHE